jgi:hypothetical protein
MRWSCGIEYLAARASGIIDASADGRFMHTAAIIRAESLRLRSFHLFGEVLKLEKWSSSCESIGRTSLHLLLGPQNRQNERINFNGLSHGSQLVEEKIEW